MHDPRKGCGLSERTLNDPVQHCDALVADFADCTKIMAWTQVAPQPATAVGVLELCSEALLVSTGKASVEASTRNGLKLLLVSVFQDLLSLAHREQCIQHVSQRFVAKGPGVTPPDVLS